MTDSTIVPKKQSACLLRTRQCLVGPAPLNPETPKPKTPKPLNTKATGHCGQCQCLNTGLHVSETLALTLRRLFSLHVLVRMKAV